MIITDDESSILWETKAFFPMHKTVIFNEIFHAFHAWVLAQETSGMFDFSVNFKWEI